MSVVFITGGNSGLGYETARQLKALGHEVIIGVRDAQRGARAADELEVAWVLVDVTDDASVARAAEEVGSRCGCVDILINNAGVSAPRKPASEVDACDMQTVFDVNVFGIVRMMRAFAPLLQKSANPVVVNVSSGLGSFACVSESQRLEAGVVSPAYCSSKAAVNMLTVQYAKAFPWMRVNAVDPRSTKTNLNGGFGLQEVDEGVIPIVAMAQIGSDGPTGQFFDRDGALGW